MSKTFFSVLQGLVCAALLTGCSTFHSPDGVIGSLEPATQWKGVHFLCPGREEMDDLCRVIEDKLVPVGVNVIVFEINFQYEYECDPLMRAPGAITRSQAEQLRDVCRRNKVMLIPQFNCLGHQSWAQTTFPLLTHYPQFDETPQLPLDNPGIYCRSWCPLHPAINDQIFAMMDELIDVFQPEAFHVGMDEVFLIGSDQCPRCHGKDPAQLFAKAVNDYHRHLVDEKGLTMLMWGDRLLPKAEMPYSQWESSANDTSDAVDLIAKDIIVCDWHYETHDAYPSVDFLQKKGFRVLVSPWKDPRASVAFVDYARKANTGGVLGILGTTWYSADSVRAFLGNHSTPPPPDDAFQMAETNLMILQH